MLIASPTSTGGIYLVFNNYRIDYKTGMIDQQPFAIIPHTTGMASMGCFVNHGDWEGRSFAPPADFWVHVRESGVGNYFFSLPLAGKISGSLDELPAGDRNAFYEITERIRMQ